MATLQKSRGGTPGLVLGFLVYDGLGSPEPHVQAFFDRTEKFSSDDPAK